MDEMITTQVSLPADRNPAILYISGLPSSDSRRTMRWALSSVAALISDGKLTSLELPWHQLQYRHLKLIKARLMNEGDLSDGSINTILSAVKGVCRQAWLLDLMPADAFQKLLEVKSINFQAEPAGRALSQGEIVAVAAVCDEDPSPAGIRDSAILALLIAAGLRRTELVNLELADYERDTGRLTIRRGKGRKDRVVFANNGGFDALADWLKLRGSKPGPLFHPIRKDGKILPRRLTPQAVYLMCKKRGKQARILEFSPHDCRRSLITDLLSKTDTLTVAKIAGHASPETTMRYDRRGEKTMLDALSMVSFPYRRKFGVKS